MYRKYEIKNIQKVIIYKTKLKYFIREKTINK